MASVVGMTVVKKFTYRGDSEEEFSNTYHFSGDIPSNDTDWRALFDALAAQEKTVYGSGVSIIRGYGYDSDADNATAVFVVTLDGSTGFVPVAGTLTTTGLAEAPGDCAVWVRWKTSRLARGKSIYLRKYYHPAMINEGSGPDTVGSAQVTALNALGTKLMDGSFIDGRTIRSRLHSETILSRACSTYSTTRTLKRRGKRPGS